MARSGLTARAVPKCADFRLIPIARTQASASRRSSDLAQPGCVSTSADAAASPEQVQQVPQGPDDLGPEQVQAGRVALVRRQRDHDDGSGPRPAALLGGTHLVAPGHRTRGRARRRGQRGQGKDRRDLTRLWRRAKTGS